MDDYVPIPGMARRGTDAQTKAVAMVAEAKGQVASKLARAQAELDAQKARRARERVAGSLLGRAQRRFEFSNVLGYISHR